MSDTLLTVRDVAHVLQCSENSVIRRFAKLDGVIDMGQQTLGVRRYRVLRIPKSVVERYLVSQQPKGNRRTVEIEVPPRADRRRKSSKWEDKAILNLAKAGLQNECADRVIYQRIANRARLLAQYVPENRWREIVWFEEDETE